VPSAAVIGATGYTGALAASLLGGPVPAVRGSREVPIPQQLLVGREPEIAALTAEPPGASEICAP